VPDIYQKQIIDHFKYPRKRGRLDAPDLAYEDDNPLCGDRVRVEMCLMDGDRVCDARFDGGGCAICCACASMLMEQITGKRLPEIFQMDTDYIRDLLGIQLSPIRLKCALLPLMVAKAAIAQHLKTVTSDE